MTTRQSIDAWLEIAAAAKSAGIRANVMISSAFGCPYEGEVPQERVLEITDEVPQTEPDELALADTIDVAVPIQVTGLIRSNRENAPPKRPLRIHLHNTRNTGLTNAQAAIDAGVASIDASIGGIGGCPFAPAATGNIPTEDLLYLLDQSGITSDVSLEKVIETSNWLREALGHDVPALLAKAGMFSRATERIQTTG